MSSVDQRVVEMKFDNKDFEKGVKDTLKALEDLEKGLRLDGAAQGLKDIEEAGKGFNLDDMASALDNISDKFSIMGAIGFTVIQNITNTVIDAAKKLAGVVFDPLVAGGKRRALNIEQAKFQFRGLGMSVEEAMADALYAVKDTAFGLDEAAKAAGQLGASGVKLGTDMKQSLRGISGLAAMTNSSYEDTANIFTKVAGQGRLMGDDLNRIGARGINAAATLAKSMGKSEAEIRKMVTEGKISFAEFSKAMDDSFGENATKANETYSGSLANLRAAFSRIGASFFTTYLENARDLFNALSPAVDKVGKALAPVITLMTGATTAISKGLIGIINGLDFSKMGTVIVPMVTAIKNVFAVLLAVLRPIKAAFQEVFPPSAFSGLAKLAEQIKAFTENLKLGGETAQRIKSTFEGVFSLFKIAISIVGGLVRVIGNLLGVAGSASGGFLAITATLGEFIRSISDMLTKTGAIDKFFTVLLSPLLLIRPLIDLVVGLLQALSMLYMGDVSGFSARMSESFGIFGTAIDNIKAKFENLPDTIQAVLGNISSGLANFASSVAGHGNIVIQWLGSLASGVSDLFAGLGDMKAGFSMGPELNAFNGEIYKTRTELSGFAAVGQTLRDVWNTIFDGITNVGNGLGPAGSSLSNFFSMVIDKIGAFVKAFSFEEAIALLNTGFFIMLVTTIRSFGKSFEGFMDSLGEAVSGFSEIFKKEESTADTMIKYAIAIGILAASLFVLAGIPADELAKGLLVLSALFIQMGLMLKVVTAIEPEKIASSSAGLILLAIAIRIMVSSLQKLAEIDFVDLLKGMTTLGVMLSMLAGMTKVLSGMKGVLAASAGLLILSAALLALSYSIERYADIDLETTLDGLMGMALAIGVIGTAMKLMPQKQMIASAAALLIVSAALLALSGVMKIIGAMDPDAFKQGMIGIALALGALVIALNLARGTLPGAAALAIAAAALGMMSTVLIALGLVPFEVVLKGLIALAGLFAVLGLAAIALTPVLPMLVLLAGALYVLGAAMLMVGAGFALFTGGLLVLATVGTGAFSILAGGITMFLGMLPLLAQQLGYAVISFAKVISTGGPAFVEAMTALGMSALIAMALLIPQFIETMRRIVTAIIDAAVLMIPVFATAGLNLMIGFLEAISQSIDDLIDVAIQIVTTFIRAIARNLPDVIQSGFDLIIAWITGLAQAIRDNKDELGAAGADLAKAIVEGLIAGLTALAGLFPENLKAIAKAAVTAFKKFLGINSPSTVFAGFGGDIIRGLISGITGLIGAVVGTIRTVITTIITAAKNALSTAAEIGTRLITGLISGLTKGISVVKDAAIRVAKGAFDAAKGFFSNAADIGAAMITGVIRGLKNGISAVKDAAVDVAKGALNGAKKFLGIASPSKAFIEVGNAVNEGFALGLKDSSRKAVDDALKDLTENLAKVMDEANLTLDKSKKKLAELTDAREKDARAIREATADYIRAREAADRATGAYTAMTSGLITQQWELQRLGDEYDDFNERIKNANKVLEDAIKTRDDYAKNIYDKYRDLPDISGETTVEKFISDLSAKIDKTQAFATAIQALRDMGLSDNLYKELLARGINALPFVEELVKGGTESVKVLNDIDSELDMAADQLGADTAKSLYKAGVDAARGLVEGLQSQQAAIAAQVAAIAAQVAEVIRLKLEIKSPSKVMARLGAYIGEGLAVGIKNSASTVETATDGIGQSAVDSMKKSIFMISDFFDTEMDLNPTITPVLDLSNMQKEASKMGSMLSMVPISLDAAYSSAASASAGYRHNLDALTAEGTPSPVPASVTFVQNNTSPKALSHAEIYRQTNNQLSVAKGALTRSAN